MMEIINCVPCEFGRCILGLENDSSGTDTDSAFDTDENGRTTHANYLQPDFHIQDNCTQHTRTCGKRRSLDSRTRRLRANDRERRRIQSINGAMEALRKAIPDTREKRKITKLQILRLAQRYIQTLTETLRTESQITQVTSDKNILEFHGTHQ